MHQLQEAKQEMIETVAGFLKERPDSLARNPAVEEEQPQKGWTIHQDAENMDQPTNKVSNHPKMEGFFPCLP